MIGPLPKDECGNKYILVIVDCFSRFTELFATRDASAKSARDALLQFIGRYGCPAQILSDNGPQFVNSTIRELTDFIGTQHVLTLAYSKQENAIVERDNKEVMRHLRAMAFDTNLISTWSMNLPRIQRILNAEVKVSLGVAPAHILFGNAINLDRGIFLPNALAPDKEIIVSEEIANMLKCQAQIIEIAKTHLITKDDEHMDMVQSEVTTYPVGAYVLVNYENRPPSKLHTPWRGPMKVISSQDSRYTVQNLVTNKLEDFHVTQLKLFVYDPILHDPRLIANKDYQVEDIERII